MSEEFNVDGIDNVVSLLDEEGNEHEFTLIDAIETDDSRYVALVSIPEDDETEEGEEELVILQVSEEDGEEVLLAIENEDEFNEILGIFEERLSEFFDIE